MRRLAIGCGLHRFQRIHQQIEQDLLQLHRIGVDGGKIGREFCFNRRPSSKQVGMEQTQDFPDDLIQIYRAPCPFALANKMMDSMNDIARAPRIRRHIGEQLFEHLEVGRNLERENVSRPRRCWRWR